MYCPKPDHRCSDCKSIRTVTERQKILKDKKFFFDSEWAKQGCTVPQSKTCINCNYKHHTSIFDKLSENYSVPVLVATKATVIYLVAIIKVDRAK